MAALGLAIIVGLATIAAAPDRSVPETAQRYLGERYTYGAAGDNGFDCSGFVQTVFRQHGHALPRTSHEQARAGRPVAKAEVAPGDLLFFAPRPGSRRVTHVGIALTDEHMIHASTTERRIVITKWDSPYYRSRWVAARRIDE